MSDINVLVSLLVRFTNSSTDSDQKQTAWREKYGGLLLAGRWKQVYSLNQIPPVRLEGSDTRCGTDRRRALEYLRGFYLIYYDFSLYPTDMKWWERGKNRAKNASERTCQLCQIKRTLEPVRVVINSLYMSLCVCAYDVFKETTKMLLALKCSHQSDTSRKLYVSCIKFCS